MNTRREFAQVLAAAAGSPLLAAGAASAQPPPAAPPTGPDVGSLFPFIHALAGLFRARAVSPNCRRVKFSSGVKARSPAHPGDCGQPDCGR
jgi:hypothetical protein